MNAWIKDIVIGLVETYNTNDIHTLCDYLNIAIVRTYDNKKPESYFIRNESGDEFIFIKSDLNPKEERYLLAHELGHAILHTGLDVAYYCIKSVNRGKLEIQADLFASELLLSNVDLNNYIIEDSTLRSVAEELGVAENLVELKFRKSS
jgi:Zn-dependent peptidase ImmA (M78 family)